MTQTNEKPMVEFQTENFVVIMRNSYTGWRLKYTLIQNHIENNFNCI